ncbi:MAG: FAD-dependent oxidoreductase [Ilumatobacteraceae bacterium]
MSAAHRVASRMSREMHHPHDGDTIGDEVLELLDAVRDAMRLLARRRGSVEARLLFTQVDLVVTVVQGIVADRVFARDLDELDGENYRDWLIRHGLDPMTQVAGIPQGYPNTALSYEYGDTTAIPTMSATAWLTFFIRQMGGVGAGAYFFRRGTGETVMRPLYEVLRDRGVRFHFFHRLRQVEVDGDRVTALHFEVQATTKDGEYRPLRPLRPDADGRTELVWPDRPLYDQLVQGDDLRTGKVNLESWWSDWQAPATLELRVDRTEHGFEHVVLATPVATLPITCAAMLQHSVHGQRWEQMCEGVRTAATQAAQLWLDRPVTQLGWSRAGTTSATDRHVGGFYAQDMTSACDFSDLIEHERWGRDSGQVPQGLVYLIGALPDPEPIPDFTDTEYPRRMEERVRWATVQFLRDVSGLMPGAVNRANPTDARSFDFGLLVQHDGVERLGVNRFDTQYWRANIDPNERYTLTVAHTMQHRMKGWENGFDNLVLAGDWTYTGFNIGSFEGAVMSGKLAALALVGRPVITTIWGYDFLHPGLQGPPAPRIAMPSPAA